MTSFWQAIRSGSWLTPARGRTYPLVLVGLGALVLLGLILTADGLVDRTGKPIGTDFSSVYAAGVLAGAGEPEAAYDPARQHAAEIAVFDGRDVPFYGWHYPPMFLAAAALLALFPYGLALFVWMALTLPAYLAVIRAIVPRPQTLLAAAAFPAVFVDLGHGQNGFLTAALLGGGLLLLDRRPIVAGLLVGLLAYKPQFGILIPLVLVVTGRWTVIATAAASVIAEGAVTFVLFGEKVWLAFAGSTGFTRRVVLEAGATGWEKIQSLFSAVRLWGGPVDAALAAQFALALALAAGLVWLWRSDAGFSLKAAALATASLLATPYVLDYDMVVLAVAIAFFVRHGLARGFRDYEVTVLAAVWASPLVARLVAGATGLPVGLAAMLALAGLIFRRAAADLAEARGREHLARA